MVLQWFWAKSTRLYPKNNSKKAKTAGREAQAVKHLPNKSEAMSSNSSTTKKKR
jgi:hypothetical protein